MRIYLASRYSRHPEMQQVAEELRAMGHEVTSRWIAGDHQIDDTGLSAEAALPARSRIALEDFVDLGRADCCISFTEEARSTNSRGGRHVEFGLGLGMGKICLIVGPRENVFCCLPHARVFETWSPAREWLRQYARIEGLASRDRNCKGLVDYQATIACRRCDGCGRIANSEEGEPWSCWEALPEESKAAVRLGLVRPIPCPACRGGGEEIAQRGCKG